MEQFYSESQTGHLSEWSSAIAQICEEKGIAKEDMMGVIENALSAAYKKESNRKGRSARADFSEKLGGAKFWEIYLTVEKKERDWSKEIDQEQNFDQKIIDKTRKPKIWKEDRMAERFEERGEHLENGEEEKLPYFRPEREMLLAEAQKLCGKIKKGEYLAVPVKSPEDFGRIAAQTAKQVVLQKIKEIEKEIIFKEYYQKVGEVLPGTVQRIEGMQVFVDLGKTIALLPRKEQVVGERYDQGQRLKVYVLRVDSESRSTMVIVSRSHPGLVESLFRLEVPEIFAGSVSIVKSTREPGQRAKIAVKSEEKGVDPVGSCIGQRGTRVQAVTDELRGERIDIIEYSDDPIVMLERAIAPAKVKKIEIVDSEIRRARIYVSPDQQSIAIGKGGQNVRLASRLTGYEIDIEAWQKEEEIEGADPDLPVQDLPVQDLPVQDLSAQKVELVSESSKELKAEEPAKKVAVKKKKAKKA